MRARRLFGVSAIITMVVSIPSLLLAQAPTPLTLEVQRAAATGMAVLNDYAKRQATLVVDYARAVAEIKSKIAELDRQSQTIREHTQALKAVVEKLLELAKAYEKLNADAAAQGRDAKSSALMLQRVSSDPAAAAKLLDTSHRDRRAMVAECIEITH